VSSSRWYIIHTISGHEKSVVKAIEDRVRKSGLETSVTRIVVPTEGVTEIRKGKKVSTERKFLPGYILICMVMNDEIWHLIKSTPKVSGFLGNGGKPQPISDSEAERIFKQMEEGSEISKKTLSFEVGESVKVIDGPFESFIGVVIDVETEKQRLKVSVSIFGRATPVDLSYTQVEKV
jgi:transcription termination/antitermination protein NusG